MAIQQYAEIEAEETTDIDDIANTKDKNELAIFGARIFTQTTTLCGRRRKTIMLCH